MRTVTSRYLQAINGPHRRVAEVAVVLPGEVTETLIDIESDDCVVTMSASGHRFGASIAISPDLSTDLWALVATPGAKFHIRSGVDFGGGQAEWIECGTYEAVAGSRSLMVGDIPLTLVDGTARLDECRFLEPWTVADNTNRSAAIEDIVTDADPSVTVVQSATGGTMAAAVFERDRLGAVASIATGGALDAAFDAGGDYIIRSLPTPSVPVWTTRTGEAANILEGAERDIPLNRLYNTVVLGAPETFQTWGAITVQIADTSHPRHYSKIGVRPFFTTDSTITSAAGANTAAQGILRRLLAADEQVRIPVLGNPALEYGDTVAIVHEATETDPGLAANYLVEGWSFNLGTGAQDITARTSLLPELEEV